MKKLIIALICFIFSGLLLAEIASAEFTVDQRSSYHVGVSGLFGFTGGYIMSLTQEESGFSDRQIVFIAGSAAMVPGIFKEYAMDEYADAGDLAFNALGAYGGAWLGLKTGKHFAVTKNQDAVMLHYVANY